jgi:dienelactone hydrolase
MRSTLAGLLFLSIAACGSSTPGNGSGPDATPGAGPDGAPGATVTGCDGASFLENPVDPMARGPWPVGARTVTIGRLTVEVFYPAQVGSDAGKTAATYDIREQLPASERPKISDTDNPVQHCDCFRDLPLDTAHGKYPGVLFVHGTAAFRHQSLPIETHWASRGFIVVAADHPGLKLGDILGQACQQPASGAQDLSGDLDAVIAALQAPTGDLAFLSGHLDTTRLAVSGHSAGAGAAAAASTKPGVQVVLSFAGAGATTTSSSLKQTLYMAGASDNIASWNHVKMAWDGSPKPRRLVEIGNAGHLVFSDLCQTKNAAGKNLLEIATANNVCGAQFAGFLFDCNASFVDGPTGWDVVNYASSSVLESVLQCSKTSPDLSGIKAALPAVSDYLEAL